jgi:hypothetical protein
MDDHETKAPRVSIVSFPKSGRTWLRVLIGKALCEHAGLDDQKIFDKDMLAEATSLPKINYTHEGRFRQQYTQALPGVGDG